MNPQAIERLREIGRTQAGALTTESGIVWHPANELLPAADALDAKDARIKELEGVLEAVDDLIQYQYSGTREAMTYLTQTCDRAREALK